MFNDFWANKTLNNNYQLYFQTLLVLEPFINFISDNDLKNSMIKFLNQQDVQSACEVIQKLYNSTKEKVEFIEILNKQQLKKIYLP